MKKRFFVLLVLGVLFLISCGKNNSPKFSEAKFIIESPNNEVNQEIAELVKAKKFKVKERTTHSYFYNKNGSVTGNGALSEKILFDESGRKSEYFQYVAGGQIESHNIYEYDENGALFATTVLNAGGYPTWKRESEFDNNGYEILRKEMDEKSLKFNEIIPTYDSLGHLIELKKISHDGRDLGKKTFTYDSLGLMQTKLLFSTNDRLADSITYQYDENNNLSEEIHVRLKVHKHIINYSYDENANLIEIKEPHVQKTYSFNENNDVVDEKVFDKDGYQQLHFKYIYGPQGLLAEKIRYDGSDNPAVFIKYEYVFY